MFFRDRPWQAYPITIISGAYIGYALGSALGHTPLLYGRRIQFVPHEDADEEESGAENQTATDRETAAVQEKKGS